MAMTKAGMSAAIKAAIIAENGEPQEDTILQKFCDALADAIVVYIQTNGVVVGTVTSGVGAGGTVAGAVT